MKYTIIVIILCGLLASGNLGVAEEQTELIKAQIGMKLCTDDKPCRRAKSFEKGLKAGDRIQIYVKPEFDSAYVYVLYNDEKTTYNLYQPVRMGERELLKLPKREDNPFYEFDGKSGREYFMILCSPVEIDDVNSFWQISDRSYKEWSRLKEQLVQQSLPGFEQPIEKPIVMAAGVKGMSVLKDTSSDPFVERLQMFSGTRFVIKTYEFQIKK